MSGCAQYVLELSYRQCLTTLNATIMAGPTMQFQHPLLPTAWHSLCHNIAKQNGISTDASALLILGSYATACGDTVQIRTPDQIALGPMIHLALVANGVSFPRGALTSLLAE